MFKKIVVDNFKPFKPKAELNFKKLNLIIGGNGVGKTRLFKTINWGLNIPKPHVTNSMQSCMNIYDENGTVKQVCLNPKTNCFSLVGGKTFHYYYISDKRAPSKSLVGNAKLELHQLDKYLFSNYLFYPECVAFTNKIFKKIFNRTIDIRKIPTSHTAMDRFSYEKDYKLINPLGDGFGILQSLGVFQVLFLAELGSTVVIEEPTVNLHPNAITPIMNEILSYADSKNIQLIIITHDIITALRFFHKIKNGDKDTTIHRFEQIDGVTYIHNTDKDSYVSSLDDFLGDFPEKEDLTLLKEIAGFNPDFN